LCRTRIISICGKDVTTTFIKSAHMIDTNTNIDIKAKLQHYGLIARVTLPN